MVVGELRRLMSCRKEQFFDVICDVVLETDKQGWYYNGAMGNTDAHRNLFKFSSEVVSRDTSSKARFNASRVDITTTEVLNSHQNKICGSSLSKALS